MSRSLNGPKKINAMWEVLPGLMYGGCHGDNEKEVFNELCRIVEEVIALYKEEGKPLPPPTSGHDFANKMQHVA
jgi:hypothetical protein